MSNKAEPTVWWSYSFEQDGKRHNSTHRCSTELAAIAMMHSGAQSSARSKFRIRKLTRKPKPKVVAKLVAYQKLSSTCICCVSADNRSDNWASRAQWIEARRGKRIRVTLEELADE